MKIEKITICNLTSLEGEQVIDFTQEPLRSASLFAITGILVFLLSWVIVSFAYRFFPRQAKWIMG